MELKQLMSGILKMNKLSIFGGTGYIGSKFREIYPEKSILIDRESRIPKTKNILYLISTTTNQNIFEDLHIDIDTNLNLLMEVLSNCKKDNIIFNFVSSCFVYGNNIIDARKQSEITKKKLITRQQEKLGKWSELVAKRDTKILEELRKSEGTIDWAVRSLLSATVKPLVGAGAGAAAQRQEYSYRYHRRAWCRQIHLY